jgi:hypothetical protein
VIDFHCIGRYWSYAMRNRVWLASRPELVKTSPVDQTKTELGLSLIDIVSIEVMKTLTLSVIAICNKKTIMVDWRHGWSGEDRFGVDENEFKQRWTNLTGTVMVKLMVTTFLSLITMDSRQKFTIFIGVVVVVLVTDLVWQPQQDGQ